MLLAGAEGGYVFEEVVPTATSTATLVKPSSTPISLLLDEKKETTGLGYWTFLVLIAVLMTVGLVSIFKKKK